MKLVATNAFTLIELLVVMVISGILLGIAFMMFQIIQQQFFKFEENGNSALVIDNFNRLLQNDLQTADFWQIQGQEVSCITKNNTIYYKFNTNSIIRSFANSTIDPDTFDIANKDFTCYFNRKLVYNNVADECSLLLLFGKEWIPINYQKEYSAQQLMNFE